MSVIVALFVTCTCYMSYVRAREEIIAAHKQQRLECFVDIICLMHKNKRVEEICMFHDQKTALLFEMLTETAVLWGKSNGVTQTYS